MTKPVITSYKDLMDEKQRLKNLLKHHKQDLKDSFNGMKEDFNPLSQAFNTTKDILRADKDNPLIGFGVSKITDIVLRKGILRRAGLLPRIVAPFLVQKISSYLVSKFAGQKISDQLHTAAEKIRETKIPHPKKR